MTQVHEPDGELASAEWDETLYGPMHAFFNGYSADARHIVYVGGGSKVPYFLNRRTGFQGQRLAMVTLVDIDEGALEIGRRRISERFPNTEVRTLRLDVTQGLAERFFQELNGGVPSQALVQGVAAGSEGLAFVAEGADVLISEMVATYTGIPALFDIEARTGVAAIPGVVSRQRYQQYNEEAVRRQLEVYKQLVAPGGTILIATDTTKNYQDDKLPPEYSLPSGFMWESVGLRKHGETDWVDTGLTSSVSHWGTPHSHRVEFLVSDRGLYP